MAWLRDPLVLFVVLGLALFGLHLWLRDEEPPYARDTEIVVTDADVAWIAQTYEKTWQRPPTQAQLRALVERRVRDEILFREARALGLDAGDDAMRRRLAMKLEFLAKDAAAAEPTEAELQAYLDKHGERYAAPGRRSFAHIYLAEDERRKERSAAEEAARLLKTLRAKPAQDITQLGDRIMLEQEQRHVTPRDVGDMFGADFATAVFAQEVGAWVGPLRSGYGLHLVLVREAEPGAASALADVHARVRGDLVAERREDVLERYVAALREKYDVVLRATALADGDE